MVEFHFYSSIVYMDKNNPYIKYDMYAHDWVETEVQLEKHKDALKALGDKFNHELHTLQMSFLREVWDLHFEYGARIFVHDHTGTYEIYEGTPRTDRELRRAHDIFKLWRAGEFGR